MHSLKRLIPYARPFRRGLAAGFLFVALANLAGIAMPWLLGRAIDSLAVPAASLRIVLGYAGFIVLATALSGAARFGMRQLLNSISRRIEVALRDDLFDHLLRLDAGFYARMPTGELMSRLTNDTQAVRMAIGPGLMYLVNTFVMTGSRSPSCSATACASPCSRCVPLSLLPPVMLSSAASSTASSSASSGISACSRPWRRRT